MTTVTQIDNGPSTGRQLVEALHKECLARVDDLTKSRVYGGKDPEYRRAANETIRIIMATARTHAAIVHDEHLQHVIQKALVGGLDMSSHALIAAPPTQKRVSSARKPNGRA